MLKIDILNLFISIVSRRLPARFTRTVDKTQQKGYSIIYIYTARQVSKVPPRKTITIYDIAREAGVSPATVSRIITGNTSVRQEKRDRVNQLIEKYNFRPNAMARALTETRTKVIGMLLADTGNPYYDSVFAACGNEAYKRGYVTMMLNTHSRPDMEESSLTKLREQRVDAIIICGGRIDLAQPDPSFQPLLKTTLETTPIIAGSRSPMERIPGVAVDHKGSVDLALDYLIGLGHREIGFVYSCLQDYGAKEKLDRFCQGMAKANLPVREEWLIGVPGYDCQSGREGIEQLMNSASLPTALLGINDMVTAGMLQGLLDHGVRVPEDISLLGFDDTYITTITSPQLTAVDYDYNEYARMLVDVAVAVIEGREYPRNQLIPPSLSVKKSCAAPGR